MTVIRCAAMLISLCLAGCIANQYKTDESRQIHVFGIELDSAVDYKEINGVPANEEPCLKGFDRSFDKLDITIGYGFNKRIRKISSRNPETSLFGISPGMTAKEGMRLAEKADLKEISTHRYQGKDVSLILLVDGKGKVFGVSVENRN